MAGVAAEQVTEEEKEKVVDLRSKEEQLDLKGLEVVEVMNLTPEESADKSMDEAIPENVELMPSSGEDIMVFARTPDEMAKAQNALIKWADRKIGQMYAELAIAEGNLAAAKSAKIRTQAWSREVNKWKREIKYYEKVHTALQEGYFIVPDFPINIIGVRTMNEFPADQLDHKWRSSVSNEKQQELPEGEGEYKDPHPVVKKVHRTIRQKDGEEKLEERFTAEETTLRSVDFPFRLIKPHLLKDLQKAMKMKVFDEIGVLPNTRRHRDPMLVGTVCGMDGKKMMFLISWWIPTSAL